MVGGPLVVHYWADLQSVHGFRYYDNIALNAKCQRVLVLALWLVLLVMIDSPNTKMFQFQKINASGGN